MLELRKFVAPEFIFGPRAIDLLGRYLENFGCRKVLIVTDPGVQAAGWSDRVIAILQETGIDHCLFSHVSANPRNHEVMRGAQFYRDEDCDSIVAVGGGSPMDSAKGIGIISSNGGNVLDFEGIDKVSIPGPPLICLPTTAGTSADVSQFAIINHTEAQKKIAIISKTVVPDVALIDPLTTTTMDKHLTACTGMDALVHAIEAYVSTASSPIVDVHALEAIRLISENLPKVLQNPGDVELRSNMCQASLQAGLAFSNASLGAVHAMAHSLGGFLDLPHGECNAILLSHVMRFNSRSAADRYRKIGEMMGMPSTGATGKLAAETVISRVEEMKQQVGIHRTLSQCGTDRSDIPHLARNALNDPCMVTNPRLPVQRDIEVIYEEAL